MVVDARVLVAKPTVIQQEELSSNFLCWIIQTNNAVKIEIETGCLPIIQEHRAGFVTIAHPKIARPAVEFPAHLTQAMIAPDPNHCGCGKSFVWFQMIS